jgi:transcriptional regulator with XRE-family HTH domain
LNRKLGDKIKNILNKQNKTIRELSEHLKIDERTLAGILRRNKIDANLLIDISIILNIDLNQFKYSNDNFKIESIKTEHWI